MSEDIAQAAAKLFNADSEAPEAATDAASNTPTGEESKEIKLDAGLSEADKQIIAWERKINSGERTLEDLKKLPNLKWVLEAIEPKLTQKVKVEEKAQELNVEEVLDRKLSELKAKEKDAQLFTEKKEELQKLNLDAAQRKQIEAEYIELVKYGVPEGKAAEKVALIAKAWVKDAEEPKYGFVGSAPSVRITPQTKRDRLAEIRALAGY